MKDDSPWRVLSSRYVIDGRHLRLRADTVELADGTRVEDYYVRETRGFAVVFAITPDDRVILVRQYKHGIASVVLELPAGGIDAGETPLACAERELAEETGYAGEPAELVRTFITDPTNSDGRFHLYLVRDAVMRGAQHLDPTEAIDVELATFDDVLRYVRDGTICVNSHVASIYSMLDRLGRLS